VVIGSGMVLVIDHLGRLARIVSGIMPMRRRGIVSMMLVITAEIASGMIPVIGAMIIPRIVLRIMVARITKIVQASDEMLGRRSLAVPAS
jgi:hypothetical protein